MSFDSAKTKDIGVGSRASLTSIGKSTTAMAYGDLTINGVQVGPSITLTDTVSSTGKDYSAISKAAAINAVTAQTGVTATVSGTTVYGVSMTEPPTNVNGTVTINGVSTGTLYTTTDASVNRGMIVDAINNMSSQTGVTATDTGDSIHGIQLNAKDGRNITLALGGTLTDVLTGLANTASTTYVGSFQLSDPSNKPIVLGSKVGGTIAHADLQAGTYSANVAQVVTATRATAAANTPPDAGTTGLLDGSALKINGVVIGAAVSTDDAASDATAASSTKAASAIAIAAAINKSTGLTGVKAVANANTIVGTNFNAAAVTSIYLNGKTITTSLGTSATRTDVVNLINTYTGETGVVASDNGKGLTLVAADGRNISIGSDAASADALGLTDTTIGTVATSAAATTIYSTVSLQSDKQFSVASGTTGDANLLKLGFNIGTFGGADNGLKVAAIDVSTQSGAQNAITAIDAALKTVSLNQSKAGAYLNRLDSVVNNLTTMSTNITASRSRILDTDYSTETTNLAKSQIISQAATAMLAQANQSAQNVLALLK